MPFSRCYECGELVPIEEIGLCVQNRRYRMDVKDCEQLRREIKAVADRLRTLLPDDARPMWGEAGANAMLAYRHLEDASLRLGKCIQAIDGGVSVYDKTQVPVSA